MIEVRRPMRAAILIAALFACAGCAPPASATPPPPGASVNVNTASAATLKSLPGIGSKEARAIVAHRAMHGPFKTVDDLRAVKKVGKKDVDRIRAWVVVQ